jgi:hypothetical protein
MPPFSSLLSICLLLISSADLFSLRTFSAIIQTQPP